MKRPIPIKLISFFFFQKVMYFYDRKLLEDFECPLCLEYMHPPIRQCREGHSMCDSCFFKVTSCPVCRAPKSYTRSLSLEILQTRMAFPCRNRSNGCLRTYMGPYIMEHENSCPFSSVSCMLEPVTNCDWSGPVSAFLDHAKSSHPDNVFLNIENRIVCNDFLNESNNRTSNWFHNIFVSDGQVFKCVFDANYETGMMRWCIFYISLEGPSRDYIYEIIIENRNDTSEKVFLKSTCKYYKQEQAVFSKNLCMFTSYNVLKKFCQGRGLSFNVKVSNGVLNDS